MTWKETLVDTLTPDTAPAAPAELPPASAGPACGACGEPAVVNWRRRLTDGELAEHVALEQERRDHALLIANPQLPPPVFPPLPDGSDDTRTLYACAQHAIRMDAAAHIHHNACTAPNQDGVDGCDCTPEPHPKPATDTPIESRLPEHWQTGGA